MVKLALGLLETALVQAQSLQANKNQSVVEALVQAVLETLPEAQLEALAEALEQTLLEQLDQALLDPPAQALVQLVRGRLQAQVALELRALTANLAKAAPDEAHPLAEWQEDLVQVLPRLEGHRKPHVVAPVDYPEEALQRFALQVQAQTRQKPRTEALVMRGL